MKVTVILASFNRAQVLALTLESIARSRVPGHVQWDVLVVDNNSNDETAVVVAEFCRRYPSIFRYAFEPRPGKSFALNTAICQTDADVIAFVDDDVTVEATWLWNLTAPLEDGTWAGVGGRTRPAEPFDPPAWMSMADGMGSILAALFDFGEEPCQLSVAPFGANMAFRREMFRKYGLFRTDLGPSPNRKVPRPNEDTEFGRRLMAAGERIRYEPAAIVYHPITRDRVCKAYFLKWWFDYGRAVIREKGKRPPVGVVPRHWLSIPKMIMLCLSVRTAKWIFSFNPRDRFSKKCWVWLMAGQVAETYRMASEVRQSDVFVVETASGTNVRS